MPASCAYDSTRSRSEGSAAPAGAAGASLTPAVACATPAAAQPIQLQRRCLPQPGRPGMSRAQGKTPPRCAVLVIQRLGHALSSTWIHLCSRHRSTGAGKHLQRQHTHSQPRQRVWVQAAHTATARPPSRCSWHSAPRSAAHVPARCPAPQAAACPAAATVRMLRSCHRHLPEHCFNFAAWVSSVLARTCKLYYSHQPPHGTAL